MRERSRLARELHDSVSQALFSMTMHARAAQKSLAKASTSDPRIGKAAADLEALHELTQSALAEMRALIFELHPDALADEGMVAGLTRQATALSARTQLPIMVTGPPDRLPLPPEAEEHLYRIALEAVHNAAKHARASSVTVAVTDLGDEVQLLISDDGTGFDPLIPRRGHLGMRTMRERAGHVGGTFELTTQPGAGTTVTIRVPARVGGQESSDA
jgi:signal transduction histidine kinase